jgi:16S rRNA C967 or C1407 C5-methylase (RsmB/RsmF family)/NOL1/NOP2/fmu family ribosome biogenesis protein
LLDSSHSINYFPNGFLDSLHKAPGFSLDNFIQSHLRTAAVSVRVNPYKPSDKFSSFEKVPWSKTGFYLPVRPDFIFDPLLHSGSYYVQEASSMFLETVLSSLNDLPENPFVLDACAAPGGKSTIISSFLKGKGLLVSNEVVQQRAHILSENIQKWYSLNAAVTSVDPSRFSPLPGFFDVILADVPCSGSGLFRKDSSSMQEWSLDNVLHCAARQRRISGELLQALKPGGYFIYSTCSFSVDENESMLDWLIKSFDLESVVVPLQPEWGIYHSVSAEAKANGYRFYPDKVRGEGFFIGVLRKKNNSVSEARRKKKVNGFSLIKEPEIRQYGFVNPDSAVAAISWRDEIILLPSATKDDFFFLMDNLPVLHVGCKAGKVVSGALIPNHSLAMSPEICIHKSVVDLDLNSALRYLRRDEMKITIEQQGWNLVRFEGHNLGWIKVIGHRINNYYPKEFRILKALPA